jgi:predicted naringenin-chalcone synthase
MDVGITAIGTANPIYRRPQIETADLIAAGFHLKASEKRLLKSIYKSTAIETRYSVLADYGKSPGEFEFFPNEPDVSFPTTSARMDIYKKNALPLAIRAIKNCLQEKDASLITHVITISCTGMYAPGIDIEIVHALHLNSHVKRTAIQFMGCYGAFNGMKVAHAICAADKNAKVLLVAVELCTIHFQKNMTLDNIISNAIFADGAAAILIEHSKQAKQLFFQGFHCDLLPNSHQEMAWQIADHGFDILLSSYVPYVIHHGILDFTKNLLQQFNMTKENIDLYAIHPGGVKILEACEEALNITKEDNKYAYQVLRDFGNMSSATILFVLKAIWDDFKPNKTIFSCAFGPGLTLESMLLKT